MDASGRHEKFDRRTFFESRCELVHTPRLISKRFLSRIGAAVQIGGAG
jgi:hypothetical protein